MKVKWSVGKTAATMLVSLFLSTGLIPVSAQNASGAGPAGAAGNGIGAANGAQGDTTGAANGNSGQTGLGANVSSTSAMGGSVPLTANPTSQDYDLTRTIHDAVAASAAVQTANRNVQIDKKLADAAASKGRPNVDGVASATRFDQATAVAIGASPPIQVLPSHEELLQLNLGEDLDIAGQIRAATDQYRLQSLADQFTLQQLTDQRILNAESGYFDLLRANHQVQVAQANLTDEQANQSDAQKLFSAGTGQKIDLLRANTEVAQAQEQLEQAQDQQGIAQSSFDNLVGRPVNTPINLTDVSGVTVGTLPTNTAAVGAPTALPLFQPPSGAVSGISLSQSVQTAYINRPEIAQAEVEVQVAKSGITLARAGLAPTLEIDAQGNYYPTTSFEEPRQRTAQITATLTVPIYDGNGTQDEVNAAKLRQQNAETDLASEKTDIALNVSQTYLNLLTADEQISAADSALQQAVAALQLAQVRYNAGVGLFLEVTDAQAALVQAEDSQIDAVYGYLVAHAQFENALGTPLAN